MQILTGKDRLQIKFRHQHRLLYVLAFHYIRVHLPHLANAFSIKIQACLAGRMILGAALCLVFHLGIKFGKDLFQHPLHAHKISAYQALASHCLLRGQAVLIRHDAVHVADFKKPGVLGFVAYVVRQCLYHSGHCCGAHIAVILGQRIVDFHAAAAFILFIIPKGIKILRADERKAHGFVQAHIHQQGTQAFLLLLRQGQPALGAYGQRLHGDVIVASNACNLLGDVLFNGHIIPMIGHVALEGIQNQLRFDALACQAGCHLFACHLGAQQ